MGLFNWKKGIGISKDPYLCREINYFPIEQFKQRLLLERRRAERLKSESSLMIVTIANHKSEIKALKEVKLKNLVCQFCKNLRETDAVSVYNDERVVILLPDTTIEAAHHVNKILHQQINQFIQTNPKVRIYSPDEFTIEVIKFPDKSFIDEEKRKKEAVDSNFNKPNDGDYIKGMLYKTITQRNQSSKSFINTCVGSNDGAEVIEDITRSAIIESSHPIARILKLAQMGAKRFFDIVFSLLLLVMLAPVFGIIALIIKLTSEGPAIFTQKRVGYNGRLFNFYKFRSMYTNNDEHIHENYIKNLIAGNVDKINNGSDQDPLFKLKNDPRVTPIGRFLRKTSLDELPQLWNVLKGDMSLIGPRPPIPYEVEAYEPWHLRRLYEMKPGITGLWQVSGRNKLSFSEQVRLDINYVKKWSFWLDLKILLKTIPVVIFPTGN